MSDVGLYDGFSFFFAPNKVKCNPTNTTKKGSKKPDFEEHLALNIRIINALYD